MRHAAPIPGRFRATLGTVLFLLAVCPGCGEGEPPADVYRAGEELRSTERVALADVLARPDDYEGVLVRIEGEIEQVCGTKGCWMILHDGDVSARVTFKDYGFFVPTDTRPGSTARIDAEISVESLGEELARHYEEETEGGDPGSVDGPQRIVAVVATGVQIDR